MSYVEAFVAAVPAANKEAYRRHVAEAAPLFKDFGATRMVEAWGDDVPDGKLTDFKGAVKAKPDEVVVFSWLEYPSKQVRDAAVQKIMTDPRMKEMGASMPFDGSRMIWGGFAVLSEAGQGGRAGYVDGTVLAVPEANKQAYRAFAAHHAELFRAHGASRVVDAWGDDVPDGKITDYKGAVKAEPGEKIVYGWVEWPSKEAREQGWQKVMADPRMHEAKAPFDGGRMIYGGFVPILDV